MWTKLRIVREGLLRELKVVGIGCLLLEKMLRVLRFGKVLIFLVLFQLCDNWGFVHFFGVNRELDLEETLFSLFIV